MAWTMLFSTLFTSWFDPFTRIWCFGLGHFHAFACLLHYGDSLAVRITDGLYTTSQRPAGFSQLTRELRNLQ